LWHDLRVSPEHGVVSAYRRLAERAGHAAVTAVLYTVVSAVQAHAEAAAARRLDVRLDD
jgi:hypothetical protein